MKNIEDIRLYLDSLCVYKGIIETEIGEKFNSLVDKFINEGSLGDIIKSYNEFVYTLFEYNSNLSFKEALVNEILLSHNPFSLELEKRGYVHEFICNGVKEELISLGKIANINSRFIKDIINKRFFKEEGIEKVKSLIDWGIDKEEYKSKDNMPYEITKENLINLSSWNEAFNILKSFYIKNGTGRASAYKAFVWERFENEEEGHLREVKEPDKIRLSDLVGYEYQKEEIIKNTKHFLRGATANNLLLYGARGTGKSSTVKAVLNEYYTEGLRLIEVDKEQLSDFTRIIRLLRNKKQKFIIFVDDLVFEENEGSYSALKTILEGRIEDRPKNILIYATTNRRHLIKERFSDRDDVHYKDTQEEQLSLADRFGITVSFSSIDQKEYLNIVDNLAKSRNLKMDVEYLHREALKWEKWYNGRSPRSAKQFIDWLEGELMVNN